MWLSSGGVHLKHLTWDLVCGEIHKGEGGKGELEIADGHKPSQNISLC